MSIETISRLPSKEETSPNTPLPETETLLSTENPERSAASSDTNTPDQGETWSSQIEAARSDLTQISKLESILGKLPRATTEQQAAVALLEQNQTGATRSSSPGTERTPTDVDAEIQYLTSANRSGAYISSEFKKRYGVDFNGNDAAAYIWIQNKLAELRGNKIGISPPNQDTTPQHSVRPPIVDDHRIGSGGDVATRETLPTTAGYSSVSSATNTVEMVNDKPNENEAPSKHPGIDPHLVEVLKREREFGPPLLNEARARRDQILEDQGRLQLSKNDFDRLFAVGNFSHHEGMRQQNVGDCYAVAAIHALSQSPHFEMIIRSSLRRLPDGSWEVKIPFLDPQAKTIALSPGEITPQKNPGFLKKHGGMKGMLPDFRRKLRSMDASEGFQALEAAFIKAKFGKVNRLSAEGGWGDDVLLQLGGDNFLQYRLNSAQYDESSKKWKYPGLESLTGENALFLDHLLEAYDPDVFIVTVSTKNLDTSKISGKILDVLDLPIYQESFGGKVFVAGHAYSLTKVDKINKIVTLHNPWNTNKAIELTFAEFKKTFSAVNAVRIDHAKLLEKTKDLNSVA